MIREVLERLIPKQRKMPAWLGGLRIMFNRVGFWISAVNFILISRTAWEFAPLLRDIFLGNYWLFFFGGFSLLITGAMFVEYALFLPAGIKFSKYQEAREERSPLYKKVKEANERVKKLEAKVGEIDYVSGEEIKKVHKKIEELRKDLLSKSGREANGT